MRMCAKQYIGKLGPTQSVSAQPELVHVEHLRHRCRERAGRSHPHSIMVPVFCRARYFVSPRVEEDGFYE